jgi:hypothetical protein
LVAAVATLAAITIIDRGHRSSRRTCSTQTRVRPCTVTSPYSKWRGLQLSFECPSNYLFIQTNRGQCSHQRVYS